MRFLKILFVVFLIYFIRRFIEMYRVMKQLQAHQMKQPYNQAHQDQGQSQQPHRKNTDVIDADYKVLD